MVNLTLAEQLLLLALEDETGKLLPIPDRALDYALAGAILADLARVGRVKLSGDSLEITGPDPVGSDPEDCGLKDLLQVDVRSLRGALAHLAGDAHGLRKRVIKQLVGKNILKEENREFLWIFHYSRYPLADESAELAVKQRLRNRIRDTGISMSRRDHVLISLVHACNLEHLLLAPDEAEAFQERIHAISSEDSIGHAVNDCLDQIHRAIMEIRTYSGM